MTLSLLPVALLAAIGLVATFTDISTRRVPNWLTLGALAAFLGLAAWQGSLLAALFGALLTSGILLLADVLGGGVGGGDVKYAAAVGAALGPGPGLLCLLIAAALTVAVGLLARRRREDFHPFAPSLAVASLLALNLAPTWTWLWQVGRWTP